MFNEALANRAVKFIESLKHTTGQFSGQPFILQPWQRKIVSDIFGYVNEDGTRIVRSSYIQIPRKTGKTQMAAAMLLYVLFCDPEPEAEIYSCAADRDQASIIFRAAKRMIEANPYLESISDIKDSSRTIINQRNKSFFRAMSSDGATKHGYNAHMVITDELHALLKHDQEEMWNAMQTSSGSRRQPLNIAITTSGYDMNSLCYRQYEYAKLVRDGLVQDRSFYPVIYEPGPKDDWTSEETWKKCNPNLGVTVPIEFFRGEFNKAKSITTYQHVFKRLYLCQWTESESEWISKQTWDESAGSVDVKELEGQPCYVALDLSSTQDITAVVALFPRPDGVTKVLPFFFLPKDDLRERCIHDKVPYDVWAKDPATGLTLTDGNVVDYDAVVEKLKQLRDVFDVREVAYDPWNAERLAQQLDADGFVMVPVRQGFTTLSEPTKHLNTLILQKKLHHGGNVILDWMRSCVSIAQKPGDVIKMVKPDRLKSGKRIDGMTAIVTALTRSTLHKTTPSNKVYVLY